MTGLRERLSDWTDWDLAAASLAMVLGIIPDVLPFGGAKSLFWSNNEIGDMLQLQLDQLSCLGILLKREQPDLQYKWNNDFSITPDGPSADHRQLC